MANKVKVDRGAGIAKLAVALMIVLAGGAYAMFQQREEAKTPVEKPMPTRLQMDSEK